MESSKLNRCIELAHVFQSGYRVKVQDLAQKFGVSKRTIFRDIRLLEETGIAVQYDRQAGTHLVNGGPHLRFSSFNEDELSLLVVSVCASLLMSHSLTRGRLQMTLAKLLNRCPRHLQDYLLNIANSCQVRSDINNPDSLSNDILAKIFHAIGMKRQIRIQLANSSSKQEFIQTKIAPYYLNISTANWYLVGRSTWHRRVLSFDLRDIERIETTEDSFEIPIFHRTIHDSAKKPSMAAITIPAGL